jgi:error-prone DNA polymerase
VASLVESQLGNAGTLPQSVSYTELHLHSHWSLLDGASSPLELVLRARELGYEALALTDHDGLYGAMEFAQCAKAWGIRPITGTEITLEGGYHLTLLCETQRGYANLCRLLSHAHLTHEKGQPSLDMDTLARHADGLIALSGCRRGEVPSLVAEGRIEEAKATARRYADIFGRQSFFIELQQNLVHGDTARNRDLVALARRLRLGVVATNNVHYHVRERHRLQDVLVATKHRATLESSHTLRRPNSEFYLKSPQEMARLFADCPEALTNTLRIADRCAPSTSSGCGSASSGQGFDLTRDLDYRFPTYPCPPGETPDDVLRRLCYEEAQRRYGLVSGRLPEQVEARLEEELRLIAKHGLAGFFLIYRDLLELGKEVAREVYGPDHADRPPGRGRGSSVGSLVCYLIGLSHIDPLKNNLFPGRFLNEEMASVPDVDLDFSREVREKLILRVYERYGQEHVGLVCSFPTYRLRSAVRDVGKALGLPEAELDRLAKLSERRPAGGLSEEMSRYPEFRDRLGAPPWRDLVNLAEQVRGFPRHVSQHVGGMVISSKPLVELVPLEKARMPGRVVCQWDKDSIDDARMVKVDFLALGMLSLVDYCLDEIEARRRLRIDLSRIDFEDPAVYDMICAGDTVGVFQVESRAQMQTLPRTRPRSLEDLTVEVAIIRPGPIVGKAVSPYILRRQGKEPVTYDHPSLEPVLKETLGVILYQEQVIQAAMAIAGFTAGQADQMRRAMSRKRSREAMAAMWDEFRRGALREPQDKALNRGVDEATARRVFDRIMGFAEFGFPKSHAAAFALLAYQSAWLKRYYPLEFTCALLNAQPMGFYPPEVIVGDAHRHGVEVLPPDVNRSRWRCTVDDLPASGRDLPADGRDEAVRIGLAYVDGVGEKGGKAIESARGGRDRGEPQASRPFRSLRDFCWRTGLRREAVENLIRASAFDGFGLNQRELLWQLGLVYRPNGHRAGERQMPLPLPTEQDEVPLRDLTRWERLAADYETMGFSAHDHPMAAVRTVLGEGIVSTAHVEALPDGVEVQVAGLVVCRQQPGTAKGFVFLVVEDEYGLANVVVKPPVYLRYRALVRAEPFVVVSGQLQRRDGTTNVIAKSFRPLRVPRDLVAPEAHNFG